MEIKNSIYGDTVIEEPVLVRLINCRPVQRLKGIGQSGAAKFVFKGRVVSRYDHSIGVMLLLRRLGASTEEQIAGLLHDIPHTAFSHVIDYVFPNTNQDFHEQYHEKILLNSEIPKILEEYGFDVDRILDDKNFQLLERDLPELCADRIDYTFQDMTALDICSEKVRHFLSHLINHENHIVFDSEKVAVDFALQFIKLDSEIWAHPRGVASYIILADALKIALKEKIITKDDLFLDDEGVLKILKDSNNPQILEKLDKLTTELEIELHSEDYHVHNKPKLRYVDPHFMTSQDLKKVSDVSSEFNKALDVHRAEIEKGFYIKIK
ncbi:MAG: HD domain-containing protein [Nanoarchaeota archaeon]|nr:HD domain-containing protein [Nanoarchaeota archaeon]